MATVILVVAFFGMIQAVTIGSEMLATARRQTLANQMITHEIEQLRLEDWTKVISALPTTTTTTLGAAWSSATNYAIGDTVTYSGVWYRAQLSGTNHTPSASSTYWNVDTPPFANALSTASAAFGTTFILTRTVSNIDFDSDGTIDIAEVTFTVTWEKNGTQTAASTPTGSWLDKLTFSGPSTIRRTYTRSMTAYFSRYGLNLSSQRS